MPNTTLYPRYTPVQASSNKIGTPGFVSAYKVDTAPIRQTLPNLGGTTPPLPSTPKMPTPLETAQTDYYSQLDRTVPTTEDEASIRENIRKNMQSTIDAINMKYQNIYGQQAIDASARLGSTRAINARAGLVGSPTGEGNIGNVTEQNLNIRKATEAEQALEIASVTEKIDARAKEEIKAKKQEALGNAEAYIKFLSDQQTKTKDDIKNLAGSGIDITKLPTQKYQELLKQSGMDDFEFQAFYNSSKPANQQTKYEYEVKDGKAVAYGVDPITGEFKVHYKDIGVQAPTGKYKSSFDQSGRLILIPEQIDPSKPNAGIIIMGKEQGFQKTYAPKGTGGGTKNALTVAEAQKYGLPVSLAGLDENKLIASFESNVVPKWFNDLAEKQQNASLDSSTIQKLWDKYRTEVSGELNASQINLDNTDIETTPTPTTTKKTQNTNIDEEELY